MAIVTEIGTGTEQVNGSEAIKRGPGRPRKNESESNEKSAPKPDTDLWLRLSNYSPADWERTIAYLYRVAPTIDRRSSGRAINLRKYTGPFDKERIMLDEGSGVYRIDVVEIDAASGQYRRIAKEIFDIMNMDYPPRVPAGDWIDDPANEVWKWAAPKLAAQQQQANAGYPPGFNMESVYDKAFEMADRMNPKGNGAIEAAVVQGMTKLAEASNPENLLKLAASLTPKTDNSALDKLFVMMTEQLKETREELRELRNRAAVVVPQKSLAEQVKELQPVVSEFVSLFSDRAAKTNVWEGIAEKLVESVPAVLEMVKESRPAPPQTQQEWNPKSSQPTSQHTEAATSTEAGAGAETEALSDQDKQFQAIFQKWGGHIVHIAPAMVDHFKRNEGSHGGYYFRDWYRGGYGVFRWVDMKREVGPGLLAHLISQHPALKVEMTPEETMKLFVTEFFTIPGEEVDVAPEEETIPAIEIVQKGGEA